ncbi:hypothetical protein BDN72DRAFT_857543 [Pluteus cervinus]|uniref:Uncharacterized protein n=1 Tax=Pluteus cervinus TaxID=181527 RepID=A0ACD3AV48_9AGAR|nr:hypothetical protein BDN72DRAFT_857543 [Pluteus cervinus]
MVHQLPIELREVIFRQLDGFDLCALAILNRDLHFTSIQHLFGRNHVFDSTRFAINLSNDSTLQGADENSAIIQGLLLALTLPFSPKSFSWVLRSPYERFFSDLDNLRRLIERVNSFEKVTLGFQYNLGVSWDLSPNESCGSPTFACAPNLRLRPQPAQHSNLRVLIIHPSDPPNTAFLQLAIQLLTLPSLEVLSFRDAKQDTWDWRTILPQIHLPNLKELYLYKSAIPSEDITTFLTRHPSLVKIDLGFPDSLVITTNSSPPLLFLPNVTTLAANPDLLDFFLRGGTALPKLRTLIINVGIPAGHHPHWQFAGVLDKVDQRSQSINVKLRLLLYGTSGHGSLWLHPYPTEEQHMKPSSSTRVKHLIIGSTLPNLLQDEEDIDLFSIWMKGFKEVECVVICVQKQWNEEWKKGKMRKLAQSLMMKEFELKVKTLRLNDETRTLEEWTED